MPVTLLKSNVVLGVDALPFGSLQVRAEDKKLPTLLLVFKTSSWLLLGHAEVAQKQRRSPKQLFRSLWDVQVKMLFDWP
jgi:hypothetical protein